MDKILTGSEFCLVRPQVCYRYSAALMVSINIVRDWLAVVNIECHFDFDKVDWAPDLVNCGYPVNINILFVYLLWLIKFLLIDISVCAVDVCQGIQTLC